MKSLRSYLCILVGTIALSVPNSVFGQWIVHDPTAYINHVLRYEQLIREYEMFYYELRGLQNLGAFLSPKTILRVLDATGLLRAGRLETILSRDKTQAEIDAAFDEAFTRVRQARGFLFRVRYDPAGVPGKCGVSPRLRTSAQKTGSLGVHMHAATMAR